MYSNRKIEASRLSRLETGIEERIWEQNYRVLSCLQAKKVIVFGCGSTSLVISQFFQQYKHIAEIEFYVDNDEDRWNQLFCGKEVKSPECLLTLDSSDYVILIASQYFEEISCQLEAMKLAEGNHFLNGYELASTIEQMNFSDLNHMSMQQQRSMQEVKELALNCEKLLIVFPVISWEYRWQRPQQILSRLGKYENVIVLYLDVNFQRKHHSVSIYQNMFQELSPGVLRLKLSSNRFIHHTELLTDHDVRDMSEELAAIISEIKPQLREVYYIGQHPRWYPLLLQTQRKIPGKIVYDCMDEWDGFNTNVDSLTKLEKGLLKHADVVTATSQTLADKARKYNRKVTVIRNGAEFEAFNQTHANGKLDYLQETPIIGYYGAIGHWFDAECIAYCAKAKPAWTFILIGAVEDENAMKLLTGISNVLLLGEKKYSDITGYLSYFDVCVIPFLACALTLAVDPVKFYEYLSTGKPIVAKGVPELSMYEEFCFLASDKEEFLDYLECAYIFHNDLQARTNRVEVARKNSWDCRAEAFYQELCRCSDAE